MASSAKHPRYSHPKVGQCRIHRLHRDSESVVRLYDALQRRFRSISTENRINGLKMKAVEAEEARLKDYYRRLGRTQVLEEFKLSADADAEKASLAEDYPSPPDLHAVLNNEWTSDRTTPASYLPNEIRNNILIELSVQDLVRCHAVSTEWMALITSSAFVKRHLRRSATTSQGRMLMAVQGPNHDCVTRNESDFSETSGSLRALCDPDLFDSWRIISYCDGLFLLKQGGHREDFMPLQLWNPAIEKIRMLPDVPGYISVSDYSRAMDFDLGIGYDEQNDDYKVAKLIFGQFRLHSVAIFSVKRHAWTVVRVLRPNIEWTSRLMFEHACFFKGAMYFLYHQYIGGGSTCRLFSINLSTSGIVSVALPHEVYGSFGYLLRVVVVDNGSTLAVSNFLSFMWVLEESDDAEVHWVKKYKFYLPFQRFVHVNRNNDIVHQPQRIDGDDEFIVVYNLETGTSTTFEGHEGQEKIIHHIYEYVPSLLLL